MIRYTANQLTFIFKPIFEQIINKYVTHTFIQE